MARLQSKIRLEQKRRARREKEGKVFVIPPKLKATQREQFRFTERYPLVMLTIEDTLTSISAGGSFDDYDVSQAIRGALTETAPSSAGGQQLLERLERAREDCRCPVEVWNDGLRVAYRSLTTRSKCRPEEVSYTHYVRGFVKAAKSGKPFGK